MADIEQMEKIVPHTSRVKFHLVKTSATWCLVSMYRNWILGSKLMLSNSQQAQLCRLGTRVSLLDLLPFIIILITAPLSSIM